MAHDKLFPNRPSVRALRKAGKPASGTWLQAGTPVAAEIFANAGFRWIGLDAEHTSADTATVETMCRAVHGRGADLLVRVSQADTIEIRRALDMGANGIIVPYVETPEQARTAVAATRYPPQGVRGFAFHRGNNWGADFDEYAAKANEEMLVIVMIESKKGVENIDAILAVEGVDGVLVGPYDMSGSYGVPGQVQHAFVREAIATVLAACKKAKKAPGQHIVRSKPEQIKAALEQGFTFICLDADIIFLNEACRVALGTAKACIEQMKRIDCAVEFSKPSSLIEAAKMA